LSRVFISHSSVDKPFARRVVEALNTPDAQAWIDEKEIYVGEDILDRLGEGLEKMDAFVILISKYALESGWVNKEVKFAAIREIAERKALILPFIIDDTRITDLPWFLREKHCLHITADRDGAARAVEEILKALKRRSGAADKAHADLGRDARIDKLISGIGPGDWARAQQAAIEIIKNTDRFGRNELFERLQAYTNFAERDEQHGVLHTIESVAQLAPWLINRELIFDLANSADFALRSSAASMCFDLAHLAPDRVPTDVVIKLAHYNEDWYVTTPATGTLKILARFRPAILQIFYAWLTSRDADEREHAAAAIEDIAEAEPEILDVNALTACLEFTKRVGDSVSEKIISRAIEKARAADGVYPYKIRPLLTAP
jgi:TIR domain-containing protein